MDIIRVWEELDLSDIEAHIIIADDIQGFCPACKKTGITYENFSKCPSCGITFKYAAARDSDHQAAHIIDKLRVKAPHLTIVDHGDYTALINRQKTKSLFKN